MVGAPTTGSKKGRFISAGQGGSPPCPAYFLQDASTKGGSSWAGGKGEASHQNGRLVSDAQPLESFVRLRGGLRGRTGSNASAPASGDRMPEAGAALAGVFRSNDQLL